MVHFPSSPAAARPPSVESVKIAAVKTRAAKRIIFISPEGCRCMERREAPTYSLDSPGGTSIQARLSTAVGHFPTEGKPDIVEAPCERSPGGERALYSRYSSAPVWSP